ncbi:4-hydroxy-tetrahydrodipicolinate reductase [Sporosarcina limicola]|uniref:4-hydroxy-tetrahydrodipicolinate reductase n=1 Tax=Sporosarcina limicola TaxID=34101 RepID=A0A927R2N6_9BACL|nr:4-hydroxy-tetrahydrodipicolinate reductase [Sporosarcina limicola]MBE1554131.1 4-hydroxy-tetrahydrodipicolinate reductase [Sporosarcina limicola]
MTIKVAIAGARGRMGSAAVESILAAINIEVVAVLDYKYEGKYLHGTEVNDKLGGVPIYTSLANLAAVEKPDVLLDLTDPDAVFKNAQDALALGIRPVVGTSGLSKEDIDRLSDLATKGQIGGIIAPNFSIGAVLMMKFSAMAARYLGDIEILEMHHDRKVDAPSGTAVKTVEMIREVRKQHKQGHPEEKEHQQGARGADVEGMKIHSIRLPGLLAHQEVLLGGTGELLSIRHDSFDRSCFMPGILMAIRTVMERKELVYGLENILE